MNEKEMKVWQEGYEALKRKELNAVLERRKSALQIVLNNLVKHIEATPPTAQDVIAIYGEIVSQLYSELESL